MSERVNVTVMQFLIHRHYAFLSGAIIAALLANPGIIHAAEDFTVILIPDTQRYVENDSLKHIYSAQTQWIKDNAASENIKFAIHLGDIVEHRNDEPGEWQIAGDAQSILEQGPDPVPYSVMPGNHDLAGLGSPDYIRDTTLYNQTFGPSRFTGSTWYGGHRGTGNENNYCFFSGGGDDYMVLSLEPLPSDDTLAWANGVVQAHSDRRVILATHMYLKPDGTRITSRTYEGFAGNNANDVFDKLVKDNSNIFMTVCGHLCYEVLNVATNSSGGKVYEILSDYQNAANGGNGWLRTLKFQPDKNIITVGSYSPTLDQYNLYGSYTLPYDTGGGPVDPPAPAPAALSGYWSLDTNGSDLVGDSNLTLRSGATIVPAKMSGGMHVTNSPTAGFAAATADDDLNIAPEFSLAMWVKYESDNDVYARVISRMEDDNNGYNIAFAEGTAESSSLIVRVKYNGVNYFVTTADEIAREQFNHIAFAFDEDAGFSSTEKIKVWFNGAPAATIDSSSGGVQGTTDFVLGKGTATTADFAGVIDEVRFYTGVLSQSEVTALQTAPVLGDANWDGKVDAADAAILAAHWLTSGATWAMGDFNGDGIVNDEDAAILAVNWQAGTKIVPEPSTWALVVCTTIGLGFYVHLNQHHNHISSSMK